MTMLQNKKRLCALFLSGVMLLSQLPITAMAENAPPEDGQIASFEALPTGVAEQTVPLGTALEQLELPETVTAAVYHVREDVVIPVAPDEPREEPPATESPEPETPDQEAPVSGPVEPGEPAPTESASEKSTSEEPVQDSGVPVVTVAAATEAVPVSGWDSDPAYDGNAAGRYVFTPRIEGRALAAGAEPPTITVTVEEASAAGARARSDEIVLLDSGTGWDFDPEYGLLWITTNEGTAKWRSIESGISPADVKTISLHRDVTEISDGAFAHCNNLEYADLSACTSLTSIPDELFSQCTRLVDVRLPDSITSIGKEAFANCSHLETLTLPEGVASIGEQAFYYCRRLTAFFLPRDPAPTLGNYAFSNTENVAIYVSNGADGYTAENGWPTTRVVLGAALSNLTATVGEMTPAFFPGTMAYDLVLPYSMASVFLSPTAAYGASTITVDGTTVNSGDNSDRISIEPGETKDIQVVVANGADDSATYTIRVTRKIAPVDISAIPGVTVPAYGETPVQTITETDQYTGSVSWSPAIPSDGKFAINTEYTATITLTAKSDYTLEDVPGNFFTVEGATSVSNDAGSGTVTAVFPRTHPGYTFHEGTLTITHNIGTTNWWNDTSLGSDLPNRCNAIRSVVVEDGVTEIGAEAFRSCGNLRSLELPASITSIGALAFANCNNLTALLLPRAAAPTLGENVFYSTARRRSSMCPRGPAATRRKTAGR